MPRVTPLLLTALLALPLAAQDQPAEAPAQQPPAEQPQADQPAAPDAIELPPMAPADLVPLLNDPDPAMREAAMARLLGENTLDLPAVRKLLEAADAPEQQQRLITVAQHHVVRQLREAFEQGNRFGDRAAIGFSHRPITPDQNPYTDRGASIVTHTMPGFPGFVHLRPGDVILQVNGRECPHRSERLIQDWVGDAVTALPPGTQTTLTVARGGQQLQLTITASSVSALSAFYVTATGRTILRGEYDRAWQAARVELIEGLEGLDEPDGLIPEDVE